MIRTATLALFFTATPLLAHEPVIDTGERSAAAPFVIDEPEHSKAIYAELDGDADVYQLTSEVPFDFYEVLAAICPRAIFINAPLHDSNFDVAGVRKVVEEVGKAYDLANVRNDLVAEYPDSAHDFPDEVRQAAYTWLGKQLK